MKIKKRTLFEAIKRFYTPAKKLKMVYVKAFIFYSSWAIRSIVHVIFLKEIIWALEVGDKWLFNLLIFFYIWFIVFQEIIDYLIKFWWRLWFSERIQKELDSMLIEKYVKLDNNSLEKIWTGKTISIIKSWTRMWITLTNDIFAMWAQISVTLIFTIYMIWVIHPVYWVLFFIVYILVHYFWYFINIKIIKYRNIRRDSWHDHTKQVVKIIMSKFEILQSSKIKSELWILNKFSNIGHHANYKMAPYIHLFFRIPWIFISIFRLWAIIFLWSLLFEWNIDFSTIVWLSWALILMDKSIDMSLELFKNITRDIWEVEKVWDLFDFTSQIKWYDKWRNFKYSSWEIHINNVTYWYVRWNNIFDKFDLILQWEKVTALVWNSWSWKTTLIKLISWYIRANSWDIVVDNQKLSKTSLKSYYKDIWYLTQEPSVFDWTILDNLTYAIDRELKKWELDEIIKLSKCDFIYDLADGIHTEIWERWIRLSWWQKQRLAIAKIMLKDPKIILLDEPTSALDSFSEEQITKAMKNLFKWRTVIIIAHRLQTVKHADDIILIENWKIKERGTHKELVKQKGQYKKMLDLQSGF